MDELLKLLRDDASLTPAQLAPMLQMSEDDVATKIKSLEDDKTILAYHAVLNEEKLAVDDVRALGEATFGYRRDLVTVGVKPAGVPAMGGVFVEIEAYGDVAPHGEPTCRFGLEVVPARVASSSTDARIPPHRSRRVARPPPAARSRSRKVNQYAPRAALEGAAWTR